MTTKCEHSWVYANYILTSDPPQRDRICEKCLTEERVAGERYVEGVTYEELKRKKYISENK